jgi:chromosome segregation ATPase
MNIPPSIEGLRHARNLLAKQLEKERSRVRAAKEQRDEIQVKFEWERHARAEAERERDAACQFVCELDAELDGLEQHGFEFPACFNEYRARLLLSGKPTMKNESKAPRRYWGTPFMPDDVERRGWHVGATPKDEDLHTLDLVERDEYEKLDADLARVTEELDVAKDALDRMKSDRESAIGDNFQLKADVARRDEENARLAEELQNYIEADAGVDM